MEIDSGYVSALLSLGTSLVFFIISILISVVIFLVTNIPLFIMAKKAGNPHPWLAFIPLGCIYNRLMIPKREYNLFNLFKTDDRKKAFIGYLIVFGALFIVLLIDTAFLVIPVVGAVIYLITMPFIMLLFTAGISIFIWRANYDILMTYGSPDSALALSIISIFVPVLMIVLSFIYMNKEPHYDTDNQSLDPA